MGVFFRVFLSIFAFLLSTLVFFTLLITTISFFSKDKESINFTHKYGDINAVNKIAILKINGPIINERNNILDIGLLNQNEFIFVNEINKILNYLKKEKIKGLIVSINSPGGSVSASYNLHNLFKNFKKDTQVEVFFHTNELLASGAYWVALSGNKIYANYGSLIGSIGVKGPDWLYFNEPLAISTGLFGNFIETKNGIKKFNNFAGKSKDIFDPFRSPTKKEIQDLQDTVNNIYNDFIITVSKNRKIEKKVILNDIGAMIYNNITAQNNFLIDDTVTLETATQNMITKLSLDNYQIIEKENYNLSLFSRMIKGNFSLINSNSSLQSYTKHICKISKFGLSAMVIQNDYNKKC